MNFDYLNEEESSGKYVNFKVQENRWEVDGETFDLKKFLIEPSSIQFGWGKLQSGLPPDWQWWELGQRTERPSDQHKQAVGFSMFLKELNGFRDLSSVSVGVMKSFKPLLIEILKGKDSNNGKLAVIEYQGSDPVKIGMGNSRVLKLKHLGWGYVADLPKQEKPVEKQTSDEPLF